MLGALCCNGIIRHCDQTAAIYALAAKSVTDNVILTLNGGKGQNRPFDRSESSVIDTGFPHAYEL